MDYIQNFFVFHPILMKLGNVVVSMGILQLHQVSSKSDEKQKSFDYSPLVLALWKVLTLWHCVKVKQRYPIELDIFLNSEYLISQQFTIGAKEVIFSSNEPCSMPPITLPLWDFHMLLFSIQVVYN